MAAATASPSSPTRVERDFLGQKTIPAEAYWGVRSARAVENFPISGQTVAQMPELVRALAFVKKAAAQANAELGVLDGARADAIVVACDELIVGALQEQFVVDVIQGGAGTSTNMNANEVVCNRALELMGHAKGRHDLLHPNDHVNARRARTTFTRPRCGWRRGLVSAACSTRWPRCAERSRPRPKNLRAC